VMETDLRVNGGYFLFRRQIFDYMRPGEELVVEPFERLIAVDQLATHRHDGFTASMDTFKDKQGLDELYAKGRAPWEVWRKSVQAPDTQPGMCPLPPVARDHGLEVRPGVRYNGDDSFSSPLRTRPVEVTAGPRSS
jgi:hypothetical protein